MLYPFGVLCLVGLSFAVYIGSATSRGKDYSARYPPFSGTYGGYRSNPHAARNQPSSIDHDYSARRLPLITNTFQTGSITLVGCRDKKRCTRIKSRARFCFCGDFIASSQKKVRRKRNPRIRVEYEDQNISGCKCSGIEGGRAGGGRRPFTVNCKVKGEPPKNNTGSGKQKKKGGNANTSEGNTQQTVCHYTGDGNPHDDKKYNKNQKKFYEELIKEIAPFQCELVKEKKCPSKTFSAKSIATFINYQLE